MKLKNDNYYKNYTNDELIDEIERGLRKGYWDKRLLPEVRRRFGDDSGIRRNINKIKIATENSMEWEIKFDREVRLEVKQLIDLTEELIKYLK